MTRARLLVLAALGVGAFALKGGDVVLRGVPGHHWVRIAVTRGAEPGHGWLYQRIVRRDTFTVHGVGLVVLRMPRTGIEIPERHLSVAR